MVGYFLTGNADPFRQNIETMHEVNNNTLVIVHSSSDISLMYEK